MKKKCKERKPGIIPNVTLYSFLTDYYFLSGYKSIEYGLIGREIKVPGLNFRNMPSSIQGTR